MSCKSSVYIANTTATNVATNSAIPFGAIQRRYGCSLDATSGGVILKNCGYYLVNATITFTAPTTGTVTVALRDDGVNVVGATASETVNTATTEVHTIAITAIVRVLNGAAPDTLTLLNTGIEITPSNVAVTVVKI